MSSIKSPENIQTFPLAVVTNIIGLSTSGFGVVVALAWNELIKKFVEQHIDPYFGKNGGLISLFIYATFITLMAVLVVMQLASLQRRIQGLELKINEQRKK